MKYVLLTLTALALNTLSAHAASLPEGSYKGEGLWRSAKSQGTYTAETKIEGAKIESSYKGEDGAFAFTIELKAETNGFYRVISQGADVGEAYCLKQAQVCHYELKAGNLSVEETIVFDHGNLYRFGSKRVKGGEKIAWQEALR